MILIKATIHSHKRFSSLVWYLTFITFLVKFFAFMMIPFMVFYLGKIGMSEAQIGWIIGTSWILGAFGGPIIGYFSDRFGTEKVYAFLLLSWSLSFLGFWFAQSFWEFLVYGIINGFCRSTIDPVVLTRMIKEVEPHEKRQVMNLNYIALNMGMVLGPLAGTMATRLFSQEFFIMISIIFFLLFLAEFTYPHESKNEEREEIITFKQALNLLIRDRSLRWLLLSGTIFMIAYIQVESTVPMVLQSQNQFYLYSMLLTENALIAIFLSTFIISFVKNKNTNYIILWVSMLFSCGFLCFLIHPYAYFLGMALITVSEIIYISTWRESIANLNHSMQATYLGTSNLSYVGFFLGSVTGGELLKQGGMILLFGTMAAIVLLIFVFYFLGMRQPATKHK